MADNIFSQIIPMTAAMAIPFPLLKAIRYLLGGRPVIHSLIFTVTWGVTCFLVLSLAVILQSYLQDMINIVMANISSNNIKEWIYIVLGFMLIATGIRKLKQGLKQDDVPKPEHPILFSTMSIIKTTIQTELFKIKNIIILFLIISILLQNEMVIEQSLIVSGIIATTSMIWVSMPLFVFFLAGHERVNILERLKKWLMKNLDVLMVFIYLFIGISVFSTGIGLMIPHLLERLFVSIL